MIMRKVVAACYDPAQKPQHKYGDGLEVSDRNTAQNYGLSWELLMFCWNHSHHHLSAIC